MSEEIVTRPDHSVEISEGEGEPPSFAYQLFFDDLRQKLNNDLFGDVVRLTSYTVATLPTVPAVASPGLIFVSDETGGAVPAFSDGTSWRRVTDRAVVS